MPEDRVSLSAPQPQAVPAAPVSAPEEVPTDLVPLPSEGRAYPPGHPLHMKASVSIRSMTARDEDILTSRALLRSGRVVSALLSSCIADKGIDPDQMLVGDRNAALIGIRITGYGPEYPVNITCPGCGVVVKQSVDLGSLPVKRFPPGLDPAGSPTFKVTLPTSKRSCTFRLLTGIDEVELVQTLERGKKQSVGEALVTGRLKRQVVELGGETDPNKLANLVMDMTARDARWLRKRIDAVTPGVEMKTDFTCATCGTQGEVEVPLGTDFFWPES